MNSHSGSVTNVNCFEREFRKQVVDFCCQIFKDVTSMEKKLSQVEQQLKTTNEKLKSVLLDLKNFEAKSKTLEEEMKNVGREVEFLRSEVSLREGNQEAFVLVDEEEQIMQKSGE